MADQKLQFSKFYFDKLNCTEIGLFLTVAKTIIFGYDYQELNVSTRIADLCIKIGNRASGLQAMY